MTDNLHDLWEKAKPYLRDQTTKITYETWIESLKIASFNDNVIVLLASNPIQKNTLEAKYIELLKATFNYLTNKDCQVIIKEESDFLNNDSFNNPKPQDNNKVENKRAIQESGLKPEYTFETFVVGKNNEFARAAAVGVVEEPGAKYNPYLIYGGVGLGKTHLMHAIGNEILANNPNSKILCVSSETFTNQLINALSMQATDKFREKYRTIDVLLIDDIQFIAGKKSTQEEFFHTFDYLHNAGKQIVLTSDKPPKDIELLDERLKSRFDWGITADISKPDYETRFAILKRKAQLEKVIIDDEILSTIATKVESNIRQLEGVFKKIVAEATLRNTPITMEIANKAIDSVVAQNEKIISSEYIQDVVAKYFNINVQDLKSAKRSADVTLPRQIAMYLCRNVAQMSLPQIGKDFGNRDHTTVMHACDKIESEIKDNSKNTKLIVESVKNILTSKN